MPPTFTGNARRFKRFLPEVLAFPWAAIRFDLYHTLRIELPDMTEIVALIVGAGRGHRFGGETPKQYARLDGEAVIKKTIAAFLAHPQVSSVQPVIHPDDRQMFDAAIGELSVRAPVAGGETRQDSVRLGLESLAELSPDMVLIHDAARPFIDAGVISRVIAALDTSAGAIPGLPVVDTLKRATGGIIETTVDRADLWRAQTPQGFRFSDILAAHRQAAGQGLTDDAAVAERAGLTVALVAGDENNAKITTRDDMKQTENVTQRGETRVGMGFDVHRLGDGDHVVLCGVAIPHDKGLIGHSDADVAFHALTDALLGAIGAGDIGEHFPPSDPQWRGVASDRFLSHAATLIGDAGGEIVNVDLLLICEEPKIGPHRAALRANTAAVLNLDESRVSIKATTTERLGFAGRGEGIAAQAVASVRFN